MQKHGIILMVSMTPLYKWNILELGESNMQSINQSLKLGSQYFSTLIFLKYCEDSWQVWLNANYSNLSFNDYFVGTLRVFSWFYCKFISNFDYSVMYVNRKRDFYL